MNQLDLYYRAFLEYRKQTFSDKECERHRNIVSHSNPDNDRLEATKFFCVIKEDWINEIEKGLVFVEKAIKEERQFIRNDGETVPIEKAKHVDKHSVEHLARHSEYISRLPEDGEDIIPDKLYMIERDSDYAVYENRFLYMLLRYLGDFIDVRLNRILELGNTYRANMQMKKTISLGKRHISYEARLEEDRANDPYSFLNPEAKELIGRIEAIEHWVNALLGTTLMEQVAKVPMVRPPITKTNVLRMNNNFKNAVALYEYVTSYEGDGYSIEERKKVYNPFGDTMADEFSEIVLLASFLTYEYGNELKNELKESYEKEEQRRREEEQQKLVAQISALKKRIVEAGETPETYMLLLEKRNRALEKDSAELKERTAEIFALKEQITSLEKEREDARKRIGELSELVVEKSAEIDALNLKYVTDMAALREEHRVQIEEITASHKEEIDELVKSHTQEMAEITVAHAAEVKEITERTNRQISDIRTQCQSETATIKTECDERTAEIRRTADEEVAKYRTDNDRLTKENTIARAELHALRQKHGIKTDMDDFSSKERFEELEEEYKAFTKLFENEWKKTKKKIRKDILWTLSQSDSDGKDGKQS